LLAIAKRGVKNDDLILAHKKLPTKKNRNLLAPGLSFSFSLSSISRKIPGSSRKGKNKEKLKR
jgi:hypothetical protein